MVEQAFRWFRGNLELCSRCGICLEQCPVLELSHEDACREMVSLINGDVDDSVAFNRCTTCNVCDRLCPENALPYELILERFNARGQQQELPFLGRLILPNEPENIWSSLRTLMDEDERALLAQWERNLARPQEEILLTGFYTNLVPFLTQVGILQELRDSITGGEGLWGCGGDAHKLGMIDATERIVELVDNSFTRLGVKRVICFMEAEAAMLAEVLPRRYGADFGVTVTTLDSWVLERLRSGRITVTRPLGMRVTVHDNCMSRHLDGAPQVVVRETLERIGCDLVEMHHHHDKGLCCGWAATIPVLRGSSAGHPVQALGYLLYSLRRRLLEAEETGAEAIVASCPACYLFLALIKVLTDSPLEIYHPLELVEQAAGGTPDRRVYRRCQDLLAITTNLLWLWVRAGREHRSFRPVLPPVDSPQILARAREKDVRRLQLLARFFRGGAVQNPVSRTIIRWAVNAVASVHGRRLRREC